MESLQGVVDRKGDVPSLGMPIRIYKIGYGLLGLGVQFLDFISVNIDRPSVFGPHVENHPSRILHPERMTIHAIIIGKPVLIYRSLLERGYIPLVKPHFIP